MLPGPTELVAVRETLYVPGIKYVWLGFWVVEVAPSPQFQLQDVMAAPPVRDRSVNCTWSGTGPLVGDPEKSAVGATGATRAWMYEAFSSRPSPTALATERITV